MSMLINGLKYIRPCQSRYSRQSFDDIVTKQYGNISATVKKCLGENQMSISDTRAQQAFPDLERLIQGFQSKKMPRKLGRRAQREYKIVRSIQSLLRQRPDVIVCRVDKTKALYFGNVSTIAMKVQEYMTKTVAYEEITNGRSPLAANLQAVNTLLDYLVKTKGLTEAQRSKLCPNLNQLELGHYYGLPKIHKPGIPLRPVIACMHAPATKLSKFLNNLLAPIYLKAAHESTFINDIDVIRELETYVANGYLKPTTKFIISDVQNLYTMIPRQGALDALARFLQKYAHHGKIGTFSIDHILRMARTILDTNYFAYGDKYYRQIRGGAMGSAFTQVLANIYMFEWEQDLIEYQKRHKEIYGRFIDDIFMTTNDTVDGITRELDKAQKKDINIIITPTLAASVNFLDVVISNENGQLRTSIYHKPTAEPYILPYTSDHPRHIHRNIPYASLVRAARICSHVDDFNSERIRTEMSLLLNRYPPDFITNHFNRFFQLNNAIPVIKNLDQQVYRQLHRKLLHQPTRREKKLGKIMNDPVTSPEVLQKKPWNTKIMFPRYLFDTAITIGFPKEFYKWWKKHYLYPGSQLNNVQVRLIADTSQTLEHFFIHKKPSKEILTRMEPFTS